MASVQKLPSGKYRGIYRDGNGKRHYLPGYTHKAAARRDAAEAEAKARRGRRADPQGHRIAWGEWREQWWPTRAAEGNTLRSDRSKLSKHVTPRWQGEALGDITRLSVQRWVNKLGETLGASTVRQCYYLLSISLDAAIVHELIDTNPCNRVTLPALPQGKERFMTRVEVDRLLYNLDRRGRMLAELLVGTGMRISEACALHHHNLDIPGRRISVVHVWEYGENVMRPYPKGKKRRTVPISDELAERLSAWMGEHQPSATCGRDHEGDHCRSGLVLTTVNGLPINPHHYTQRNWAKALRHANIGHARPHDLRHTYASWLLDGGTSLPRVSKLLGHASMATTERYAFLMDEGHDEVRAVLNGLSGRETVRETPALTLLSNPDEREAQ